MDWYIREESGDAGPFSTNDVIARYNDGTLLPTSRVRASDSSMWQELKNSPVGSELGIKPETITSEDGKIRVLQPGNYKSVRIRWIVFQIFLVLFEFACLVSLLPLGYLFVSVLITTPYPVEFENNPQWLTILSLHTVAIFARSLVLFLPAAICFALFFQPLMNNVRCLGAKNVTMSPASVWFWYFVPGVNLFLPAKAMGQVWSGLHILAGEDEHGFLPVMLWWGGWVAQAFLLRGADFTFWRLQESSKYSVMRYDPAEFQLICGMMFFGMLALLLSTAALHAMGAKMVRLNSRLSAASQIDVFR